MKYCDNCKGMIVMDAFSDSNCQKCGKEIVTPHIPSYKYCEDCASELGVCEQCGSNIINEE